MNRERYPPRTLSLLSRKKIYPSHIFIALMCLSDILHELGIMVFPYSVITNGKTPIQSTCFWIEFIPMIGVCTGNPFMLNLGLDRLVAVCFPMWYRYLLINKCKYVLCHCFLPVAYASYLLKVAYLFKCCFLLQFPCLSNGSRSC
ncbi:unnamed protein product [Heligmosomoides polygyrus]|uniref:G_PROTEIN_RECEP_F1_2 domain-containing protein n=1 Tax=Heligmosomoides polygyrus TaxID=6339 RepID=A0A183FDH7_HELPZ|nr:unnamed protein product [Heligmosomoides polygyrus]